MTLEFLNCRIFNLDFFTSYTYLTYDKVLYNAVIIFQKFSIYDAYDCIHEFLFILI